MSGTRWPRCSRPSTRPATASTSRASIRPTRTRRSADAPSLGLHESQSRLWENIVGRSRPFWEHYTPVLRGAVPGPLADAGARGRCSARRNRVEPSLIRVEADEVTYNLHILLRFELELALLRDQLEVAELPAAWNDAYERPLGVRPPNDG